MRLRSALLVALSAGALGAAWLAWDLNGRLDELARMAESGRDAGLVLLLHLGTPYLAALGALAVLNLAALLLLAAAFREERALATLRVQRALPKPDRSAGAGSAPEASTGSAAEAQGAVAAVTEHAWASGTVVPWTPEHAQAFLELWNRACTGLYQACPLEASAFEKLLGSRQFDPEASAVALAADGKLAGAVLVLHEPAFEDDGYWWLEAPAVVAALLVDPAARRTGAGRALLGYVESAARRRRRPRLFVGGLENFPHLAPGIPEQDRDARVFFTALGYREVRRTCHMEAGFRGYRVPQELVERERALKEKGFSFAPARAGDVPRFQEFLAASTLDKTARRLEKFTAEPERFYLACKDLGIVGFLHVAAKDEAGRSGIHLIYFLPAYRGAGLGSVLLIKAHELWQAQGAAGAVIWTYPEAAARFYPRAGFQIVQEWLCFEKELEHDWDDPQYVKRWR